MLIITLELISMFNIQVLQIILRNIERHMLCNLVRFKNIGELQMMQADSQKAIAMVSQFTRANMSLRLSKHKI